MQIEAIRTPSLGDTTYVLTHEESAIVVDPQRDIHRFLIAASGLAITHVLETHVHNDYVSGGRDLARQAGADLVLPAGSGVGFTFVPAFHKEDLEGEAGLSIRPLHTPGHTPEHVSYLILIDGESRAVFTGGSLLVGSAGRSDLLGGEFAQQLAILQFGSLQRLGLLPDEVGVYPTHGEGSFCSSSAAVGTTSTIGREKAESPLFRFDDAIEFASSQLSGLGPYPAYYSKMAPINRLDPTAVARLEVPELGPDAFARQADEATVVDGRSRFDFAAGHVPGSLGIELDSSFAPWTGWLLRFNSPVVLVLNSDQSAEDAAVELARIGFTDVRGVMRGTGQWAESGRPLAFHETVSAADLIGRLGSGKLQVVDVRDPQEWAQGHIPDSIHRYVPDLVSGVGELDPGRPTWVICRTGARASIAAGLLARHGIETIVVAEGGVPDVLAAQATR